MLIRLLEEEQLTGQEFLKQGMIFNVLKACQQQEPQKLSVTVDQLSKVLNLLLHNRRLYDAKWPSFILGTMAKSSQDDALTRSEELLVDMEATGARPNMYDYAVLLRAYADRGLAEEAEHLLDHMEEKYEAGALQEPPNKVSYSCVVKAWANSKGGAASAESASQVVARMEEADDDNMRPNAVTYGSLLQTYGNAGMAEAAERTFQRMFELFSKGKLKDVPNHIHLANVLDAFANSNDPDAPQRAKALFDRMRASEYPISRPGVQCYAKILKLYKKRNMVKESVMALKEMTDRFVSGELDQPPNLYLYNSVLDTVARSRNEDAPIRAESLLNLMFEMKEAGHPNIEPDTFTFKCVLECYSKSNMVDAAENLLQQMVERYDIGHVKHGPDTRLYNYLLNIFAKSNNKDSTERAEKILNNMLELHAAGKGGLDVRPDVISYTTLLACYAREGNSQQAELLLQKMHTLHETGELKSPPNHISYSVVLHAHANSRKEGASELAKTTFNRMLEMHATGVIQDLDGIAFMNMMMCYMNEGKGEEAEELIRSLHDLKDTRVLRQGPTVKLYNTALNALAKSKAKDAPQRAKALFNSMKERFENRAEELRPDVITYTTLLKSYATAGMASEAEKLLLEMYALHDSGVLKQTPNIITWNSVMNAIAQSSLEDAPSRAETLLKQMKERGIEPDNITEISFVASFNNQQRGIIGRRKFEMMTRKK